MEQYLHKVVQVVVFAQVEIILLDLNVYLVPLVAYLIVDLIFAPLALLALMLTMLHFVPLACLAAFPSKGIPPVPHVKVDFTLIFKQ